MSTDAEKDSEHLPLPAATAPDANGDSSFAQTRRRWVAAWRRNFSSPKAAWRNFNAFTDELSRDYTFWLHMMAVRGGLSVVVTTAALGVAYAATLPFALAATVIAGLVVAGGAATIMMAAGARYLVARVRGAYDALVNGAPPVQPKSPPPPASLRGIYRGLEKIGRSKIVQKIGASREWRIADQFVRRRKPWLLGAGAYGGATASMGVGLWVLAGQILVLPVVAIGSAITFVTLAAASGVVSGMVGFYFATKAFLRWRREEKAAKSADAPLPAPETPAPVLPDCAPAFNTAQEKPANENAPAKPASGKKASPRKAG